MKMLRALVMAVVLGVFVLCQSAFAIVILEDDFNGENGASVPADTWSANYTGFVNWNVIIGTVDLCGPAHLLSSNGLYVDMTGSDPAFPWGTLQSKNKFALAAGTYELKFDLWGGHIADSTADGVTSLNVFMGSGGFDKGIFNEVFTLNPFDQLSITRTFDITSDTEGYLTFDQMWVFDDAGNLDWSMGGTLLDNIKLSRVSDGVVPEPSSMILLSLGGLGLGIFRRKRVS